MKDDKIIEFIKIFQSPSNIKLFTEVSCYWFAHILINRFNGSLVYNPTEVHFAAMIRGNVYDITGRLDNKEDFIEWSDDLNSDSILENCMLLV